MRLFVLLLMSLYILYKINGICLTIGGSVYEGEWKKGKFQGSGTYRWHSGAMYIGEWADGK
jgi:hypothetical protein